jgi:hypothetical protein
LDQLLAPSDPSYPSHYASLDSLFLKAISSLRSLPKTPTTMSPSQANPQVTPPTSLPTDQAGGNNNYYSLDLAAANFHRGRFLGRHQRSRGELEAGKRALWEASEYFRGEGTDKKMDSIRGVNGVIEIMTVEVGYKGVEKEEVSETMRKLREDALALRVQRKAVAKDKVVAAKIDKVFEQSYSVVTAWLERASTKDPSIKQCMEKVKEKESRSVEEVISFILKTLA